MKRLAIYLSSVIFLLSSCNNHEFDDLSEMALSSQTDQQCTITSDEAIKLAKEAITSISDATAIDSRAQNEYDDASVNVVLNSDVPLYVVNFDKGGYAVVCGQSNVKEPVLVMSSEGRFETNSIDPNNPSSFLLNLASRYKPGAETSSIITPNDNPDAPIVVEHDGHMCYLYITRDTIGSKDKYYVRALWDQGYPYNFFCPTIDGKRSAAGCLPVAMAQIMSYFSKPTSHGNHSYNWGAIHSTVTKTSPGDAGAVDLAHLIHDLGVEMGSKYGTTTPTNWDNAYPAFKSFGYQYIHETSFTFEKARAELEAESPVLAMGTNPTTGGCHAWVIDGVYYHKVKYSYRRVDNNQSCMGYVTTENELLHCNWGWDGYNNTYVNPELFDGNNTNIRIYINIYLDL